MATITDLQAFNDWDHDIGKSFAQTHFPGMGDISGAEKWATADMESGVSSASLSDIEIKERIVLVDDWCRVGDLGFIFAARGLGKTWLAMHLAHGLATQTPVGPWKIYRKSKILYVDGEMSITDIRARDRALGAPIENLVYLNHEILFDRSGRTMNLADRDFQEGMIVFCAKQQFEILFLDNLSTLATGMDESKTIDWELIQPWLLRLRRAGITVIFIHHAGRNNQMRGASKREDPAAWILRLDDPNEANELAGAHFISRFTKCRGALRIPKSYEWRYKPELNGEIVVEAKESGNINVFLNLVELGLDTCGLISEEMGVSKAYVSKLAAEADKRGWLEKRKGKYVLTSEGDQ